MILLKSRLSLIEEASNRCSLAELSLRKTSDLSAPPRAQGVPQPLLQRGDGVLLPAGHGRRHHPLRLRAPRGRLRKVLQNRREYEPLTDTESGECWTDHQSPFVPADERLHQGAEGAASQQRGRPPQRSQVRLRLCFFSPLPPPCAQAMATWRPRPASPGPPAAADIWSESCAADGGRR